MRDARVRRDDSMIDISDYDTSRTIGRCPQVVLALALVSVLSCELSCELSCVRYVSCSRVCLSSVEICVLQWPAAGAPILH